MDDALLGEIMSALARRRWASKTKAQRREHARKMALALWANTTKAQRSEVARKRWAKMRAKRRKLT